MDCYTENERKISRPVIFLFSSEVFASIWCRQSSCILFSSDYDAFLAMKYF
jgi:hypothetical protein